MFLSPFNFPSFSFSLSVDGLKCYTDVAGKQITTCKETEGYRTCFTKYNDSKSKLPRTARRATLIAAKLP